MTSSVGQEILHILWNTRVHSRVHKIPQFVTILFLIKPFHAILYYLFKVHFNIILSIRLCLQIGPFSLRFLTSELCMHFFSFPCVQHDPPIYSSVIWSLIVVGGQSRRPRGLWRKPVASWLLGQRVRIPLKSRMLVSCVFCQCSGLCDGLITPSGDCYRFFVCLIFCDFETSKMGRSTIELGCRVTEKKQCLLMATKLLAHHYVILSNLPLIRPSMIHVSSSAVCSRKPSPVYGR
jgi:hypothetical protein